MDLQPLPHQPGWTPEVFRQLFQARLGSLFEQAMACYTQLSAIEPRNSYSVANSLHMALQAGVQEQIVHDLERWCGIVKDAPNALMALVDTRQMFDILYADRFMRAGHSFGGLGPFQEVGPTPGGKGAMFVAAPTKSATLWTPS